MRALLASLVLLAAACSSGPTDAQCDQLVAHVIELEVAAAETADGDDLRGKLEAEIGDATRRYCRDQLPVTQVECALAASDRAALEACDMR